MTTINCIMKAEIVPIDEIKKTPEQQKIEELINKLGPEVSIKVPLEEDTPVRKLNNRFRHIAKKMDRNIKIRPKERNLYIMLKP